jgi:hypothetical protein
MRTGVGTSTRVGTRTGAGTRTRLLQESGLVRESGFVRELGLLQDNLHPLLLNIKLYVFADAYMIEPLKTLSKQKMMAQLQELGNLANGHERDAVFDVLTFAFSSRLPEQDVLLHWLARYASWRLDELKQMQRIRNGLCADSLNS